MSNPFRPGDLVVYKFYGETATYLVVSTKILLERDSKAQVDCEILTPGLGVSFASSAYLKKVQ